MNKNKQQIAIQSNLFPASYIPTCQYHVNKDIHIYARHEFAIRYVDKSKKIVQQNIDKK
jgi:hypothetical protein